MENINKKEIGIIEEFIEDISENHLAEEGITRENTNFMNFMNLLKPKMKEVVERSLINTNWKNIRAYKEGLSSKGRRQSDYFLKNSSQPKQEYNVWATLQV